MSVKMLIIYRVLAIKIPSRCYEKCFNCHPEASGLLVHVEKYSHICSFQGNLKHFEHARFLTFLKFLPFLYFILARDVHNICSSDCHRIRGQLYYLLHFFLSLLGAFSSTLIDYGSRDKDI